MCRVELVQMSSHVVEMSPDVASTRQVAARILNGFKILVRVFISYAYRADVVEVSHKLVQTSCISRHFSSLLAVLKLALPGTSFSTSFGNMSTTSSRHAYDVCARCYELPRQTATSVRLCTSSDRLAHDIDPSYGELSCCTLSQICSLHFYHLKSHGSTNQKWKRPVKSKRLRDHHYYQVPSCNKKDKFSTEIMMSH